MTESTSKFILVDRRLDTPGVVVARRTNHTDRVELYFRPVQTNRGDNEEPILVRVMQESTGLGIVLQSNETFRFTLAVNDSLWVSASQDVICWQVWGT